MRQASASVCKRMYYGGLSCRNHRVLKRLHPPMAHHPVRRDALVRVHLHSCQLSRRPSPFNKHRQNSQPDVACNRSAATQDFTPRRSLTKLKSLTTALDCSIPPSTTIVGLTTHRHLTQAVMSAAQPRPPHTAGSYMDLWTCLPAAARRLLPNTGVLREHQSVYITVTDCAFDAHYTPIQVCGPPPATDLSTHPNDSLTWTRSPVQSRAECKLTTLAVLVVLVTIECPGRRPLA